MAASKPELRHGLAACELDGEKVLYDESSGQLHYLNLAASLIADLSDGMVTVRGMAEAIADVYEMPFDEVHSQVRRAVRELRSAGILRPIGSSPDGRVRGEFLAGTGGAVEEAASDCNADGRELVRVEVPRSP